MDTPWNQPLAGVAAFLALGAVLALAWRRQRRTRNAGIVDVLWAGSIGVLGVTWAALADGWAPRRVLVAVLIGLWSLRLTLHLAQRVAGEAEDGRYAILRERWGERFDPWMFWFFQAQAVLALLLSLTFLPALEAQAAGWRVTDALAVALWLASVGGEALADAQLRAFRARPESRGRTCREGLWGWSRHPNYFFEWLHWLVYPLLAVGLPGGLATWLAPALMLFLVLRVTGVPPTEEQSLRSRGDDYRAYQRSTNAFFPWPPEADPAPLPPTR